MGIFTDSYPGDRESQLQARIAALEAEKNLYFTKMQEEFRRAEKAEAELVALKVAFTELAAIARREHFVLDDDCWYSCPASGRCCRDDGGERCDCGADATNARIDAIIAAREDG